MKPVIILSTFRSGVLVTFCVFDKCFCFQGDVEGHLSFNTSHVFVCLFVFVLLLFL